MKRRFEAVAQIALAAIAAAGASGCKTKPFCEELGKCGGELFLPTNTDITGDGRIDREWVVLGQKDGVINEDVFCQDELQVPPTPVTLLRQPPVQATDRPPDKVTADWCSNIVFASSGEVKRFIVWAPPLPIKVGSFQLSQDAIERRPRVPREPAPARLLAREPRLVENQEATAKAHVPLHERDRRRDAGGPGARDDDVVVQRQRHAALIPD